MVAAGVFLIVVQLIWLWWDGRQQDERMNNLSGYNDSLNAELNRVWRAHHALESQLEAHTKPTGPTPRHGKGRG